MSLHRATSYNLCNVRVVSDRLDKVINRYKFDFYDLHNVSETNIINMLRLERIFARKDVQQVSKTRLKKRDVKQGSISIKRETLMKSGYDATKSEN